MTTDGHKLRIGVLSTANIGRTAVVPATQVSQRCEVVAVASRNVDTARAYASELGIDTAYGSYADLLAAPDIDAVYNPLPNHLHTEWNLAAIAAGKHVLAEKPLGLNLNEVESVFAAAEQAGVKLVEAYMYRSHPAWQAVRQLIADGEIGDLAHVQTYFGFSETDPNHICNQPEYGGGALMDIGCYGINVAMFLFGGEARVSGASHTIHPEFGTDIRTSALLDFEGGTASFVCATAQASGQWVHILGATGRIDLEIPFNIPTDRATRVFVTLVDDPPDAPVVRTLEFAACNQYTTQADAFAAHVLDGAPPNISPAESIATARTIDEVRRRAGQSA